MRIFFLGLVVTGPNCASTTRSGRTSVTVGGAYSAPRQRTVGCAGATSTVQNHRLTGGMAKVRVETEEGFNAQADLSLAHGTLTGAEGFTPVRRNYSLGSFGLLLGIEGEHAGIDIGGTVFHSFDQGETPLLWPRLKLRVGRLNALWAEVMAGPYEGLFDGRLIAGGFGFRYQRVRGNFGVAFATPPLLNARGDNILLAMDGYGPYGGAYLDLAVDAGAGFSIVGATVIAKSPTFSLGIAYDIPH